ncbi:MAG: HIT domain-containing protein [Clostridia bacterium]|nr:HIT domain-containing protein [Clostridia bacterium]
MENKDCIFCKIIKDEVPCYKIYEDESCFAFLDIAKDYYGHILVIPKKHYENIFDVPIKELNIIMKVVQKISKHLVKNCGFDGVSILNCNGQSAEQSVIHLHFHIIPRKNGDKLRLCPTRDAQNYNLDEICNKIKILD